jgi:hypothetical protein
MSRVMGKIHLECFRLVPLESRMECVVSAGSSSGVVCFRNYFAEHLLDGVARQLSSFSAPLWIA